MNPNQVEAVALRPQSQTNSPRSARLSTLVIVFAILCAAPLAAPAQSLAVRTKVFHPPEMGLREYLELDYGTATFVLIPPPNWRVQLDARAATLQFFARTGTVSMSIQFTTNDAQRVLASTETLRRSTVPYLGDASVVEEFSARSGDAAGKGVDLGFTFHGRAMRCRAAAVPFAGGCVYLVLNGGADEFKAGQQSFGALTTSFQRWIPEAVAKK